MTTQIIVRPASPAANALRPLIIEAVQAARTNGWL